MLTLSQIKEHCRLELDQTEEDNLLKVYGRAAWRLVQSRCGRKLFEVAPPEGATEDQLNDEEFLRTLLPVDAPENALPVTDDVRVAMLLVVAHWFKHREAVTEATSSGAKDLPLAFDALINPYRWITL